MGTLILYLYLTLLSLTPTVGLSPVTVRTQVRLDPRFIAGTVCLIWDSEDAEAGSDCWTVEDPLLRTWTKYHKLRGQGVYAFWVTQVGQDTRGNALSLRSPEQRVEVY